MEKITHWKWFWVIKSIIGIFVYAILAIVLYDIIAEATMNGSPITGIGSINLATPLDDAIPFISIFTIFYVFIFYPFVILTFAYFAFAKPEKFDKYFLSILIIYAVAFLTYLLMPVMMNRPSPDELPNDFLSRVMKKYYEKDRPVNCFPSLHAANSTMTAFWLSTEKPRYKWLWWFITFMVILSTLFVRQHVIVDEVYGFALAYLASYFSNKWIPEKKIQVGYHKQRLIFAIILGAIVSIMLIATYLP